MSSKDEGQRESPAGRSQLSLFQHCQKRWAFKYVKGFLPVMSSDPLILGSAIHDAQAMFYQGASIIQCTDFLEKNLQKNQHLQKKANAMFAEWYRVLGQDDRENCTALAIETEAPLRLPNGYTMTVRWDRILLDNQTGDIFISDTKTTSGGVAKVLLTYNYSDQPKLYIASVEQNNPEWIKQFRGWRTDVVYGFESKAKKTPGQILTEVQRSEIVTFTPEQIGATLDSYAVLTDDIAYKLDNVKKGEDISKNFVNSTAACYSYGRVCPYYNICHQIDSLEEPPANMTEDPWLKEKTVLKTFDF